MNKRYEWVQLAINEIINTTLKVQALVITQLVSEIDKVFWV